MTATAGFFLACTGQIYWKLLAETLVGIGLVIAAACVFNNVIDKEIDSKMARTRQRAVPAGKITENAALIYGSVLLVIGMTELSLTNNWYVFSFIAAALFLYVTVYGLAKRRTVHSTLIGAIPGALPPAAGYLAVSDHINGAPVLLFLAWALWQLPHFYSIAIYRCKDYKAAGLPVLTVKKDIKSARHWIIFLIAAFGASCSLLSVFGYAGWSYTAVMLAVCAYWLYFGVSNWSLAGIKWGKRMFFISLLASLAWSVSTALAGRLP